MHTQLFKSHEEEAFMALVRSGLRDDTPDETLFGSLTSGQWEEIYRIAKRQTVCGICYSAFSKLPDRLLPPDSVMARWVARVNAIETNNLRMSEVESALIELLREAGLHPVVQKGLSVARLYACPELRECGDIDIWVPGEEMKTAMRIAREISPNVKSNPDRSISFIYNGYMIEFHRVLISISRPASAKKLDACAIRLCMEGVDHNNPIPSPPALLELLLINVHIMRHAFGTGIGLRQICDYYCACSSLCGKYDPAQFAKACKDLGISRWTAILNEFLIKYLDAPESILPPYDMEKRKRVSPGALLDIIREGGNFGHHIRKDGKKSKSIGRRKLHTTSMFIRRSRFAMSVAPAEAFFGFMNLVVGQLHNNRL